MNSKTIITCDSTMDLSPELISRYDIRILPLHVFADGQEYRDGIDISPDDIYDIYQRTGKLPSTAAPNVEAHREFFENNLDDGDGIVHFTISSDMSSSYSNACIAAQDFKNIHVVDTRSLSTGGALLVIKAAELSSTGIDAASIADLCSGMTSRIDASMLIQGLEYLAKGGRCTAAAAFGANLFNILPCIEVVDGGMRVAGKLRGKFAVMTEKYVHMRLTNSENIDTSRVFVTHSGCAEDVINRCLEAVKSSGIFQEILFTRAGCTISSHCGPNTIGVLFLRK